MFDVGFSELLLVGVVALLVVGPERLPRVARTLGLWIGKGRSFLSSVKADIDRELKADELKRILEQQQRSNPLEEIVDEAADTFKELKESDQPASQKHYGGAAAASSTTQKNSTSSPGPGSHDG